MSLGRVSIHAAATALALWLMLARDAAAQLATEPTASPTTRMVYVDGIRIRVGTAGFDNRKPDEPVVVFEGGASASLETWDSVLPSVAQFAPVVAYDRAGTGQSAWDALPPTPDRVATRLSRLLSQIGVDPPYVLVGHSWGGALVRYFAGQHPRDVIGVLYIDPTDITVTRADLVGPLRARLTRLGLDGPDSSQLTTTSNVMILAHNPGTPSGVTGSSLPQLLLSFVLSPVFPMALTQDTAVYSYATRIGA
jgi:pimeloyl-ACP methyl ester carboxylesterase